MGTNFPIVLMYISLAVVFLTLAFGGREFARLARDPKTARPLRAVWPRCYYLLIITTFGCLIISLEFWVRLVAAIVLVACKIYGYWSGNTARSYSDSNPAVERRFKLISNMGDIGVAGFVTSLVLATL